VNVTRLIKLEKDGGQWEKREVAGSFSVAQASAASALQGLERKLAFPQFYLLSSTPGAEFTVCMELDMLEDAALLRAAGGPPRVSLAHAAFAGGGGGTGATPARVGDDAAIPPAPPRLSALTETQFSTGRLSTTLRSAPSGSSLALFTELHAGSTPPLGDVKFLLTVLCEHPFTLRHANPGQADTSEEGVVHVSALT